MKLCAGLKKYLPKEVDGVEVKQFFQERLTVSDFLKAMENDRMR